MSDQKQDCEDLMNSLLAFAKEMLSKYRAFFPFGGTMSAAGEIGHVAGWTGSEHPPSAEVITLLENGFRDGAALGKYRATAVVFDVRVLPPGGTVEQDAIAITLEHRDRYSAVVMFPYAFSRRGDLELNAPFTSAGLAKIFTH